MNKEQSIQSVLRKLSATPMKVEFADSASDIVQAIKKFSLADSLNAASQAQKMLKQAATDAENVAILYESRLKRAKQIISVGDEYGLPVDDVKQVLPMAEKNVQQAKNLAKILNDVQGKILTAF